MVRLKREKFVYSLTKPLRPEIIQNARHHKTKMVKVISAMFLILIVNSD